MGLGRSQVSGPDSQKGLVCAVVGRESRGQMRSQAQGSKYWRCRGRRAHVVELTLAAAVIIIIIITLGFASLPGFYKLA